MRENLTYIELGEEKYPIKCTLGVLEAIQEEYGKISTFEKKLGGLEETGKKNEKGGKLYVKGEPSIKAVRFVLPLMVNDGIDMENQAEGTKRAHLTEAVLQEKLDDVNVFDLADALYREFLRCFVSKNRKSTQEEEKSSR